MKNIYNKPPAWCPDAVPSDKGWRHHKTGELLVSVRGGVGEPRDISEPSVIETVEQLVEVPDAVEVLSENIETEVIDETPIPTEVIPENPPAEEVISEIVETPKKPAAKRAKKNA